MRNDRKTSTLRRVRRVSYLLDNAIPIPGTGYRIGLDPIIGLLPGGGDFVGTIISSYIVVEAARLGVSRSTLVEMVLNILLETVTGSVPVLGDLVDAAWKANVKNVELLEKELNVSSSPPQKSDWLFLILLLAGLAVVLVVAVGISLAIVAWVITAITS
ncbi:MULTISPECIES: DUF4112 domain-containing protein [unclassified Moorena]|uniref:DUF4112 domain-containing protein n=1 Tax=unclassified Moorena TaxID=2683338 RepID=UPI0013B8E741|nr:MULTISPECIES: DUF4112 domain-containing protein [unclassified Moorena]NEP36271.1 DUF4112 domain-containing protein [Moorena sp. SIO3B2]NEQ08614.1 DUF4112 domain-containing protein [Moorena sp. SIO4E2]NES43074.1 DUF4112 domain-containing protein [Moorena sp. SIO2C4]NET68036.1 DUF4112 domain-containing protein [Moorena sp. SIO1G6]